MQIPQVAAAARPRLSAYTLLHSTFSKERARARARESWVCAFELPLAVYSIYRYIYTAARIRGKERDCCCSSTERARFQLPERRRRARLSTALSLSLSWLRFTRFRPEISRFFISMAWVEDIRARSAGFFFHSFLFVVRECELCFMRLTAGFRRRIPFFFIKFWRTLFLIES